MIDQSIVGANWIELPLGAYSVRENMTTFCQIEVDVAFDSIISHSTDAEWLSVAPLRILSFDIECQGRMGHFPDAEEDPVIQIANVVKLQGSSKPFIQNVFVLGTCAPIVGAKVFSFETEEELLQSWCAFIQEVVK